MTPIQYRSILAMGLAALAARGETGPGSEDNCKAAAAAIGELDLYEKLLRQRRAGVPIASMNTNEIMEAWRELNAQTEIAARSIQAEAKRRGIKLPQQFTRAFSFE